ncbi:transient receptor potential cation channel subfamily a member 1-like isoform x1 [Gigaspora margarita]|nr:transient receptor potential cation channel subfamily a member 1-like isoform x1 [Gigaspora margarita]
MKNKSINNIQKLKYPKRTYDVIIYNFNPFFDLFDYISNKKDLCTKAYNSICTYFNMCLNKHYFLVDTTREDFKYIELYDLMTNQLVNTFQRQMVYRSIVDFPACYACYAISNNSKLLAYESIQAIKIYSTECSLEIAELAIANLVSVIFMDFFHNDEMLLIYSSKNEWTIWNIFGSIQNSVTLENPGLTVELPSADKFWEIDQSNSFVVVNNYGKLTIYDDLIVDKYLKYLKKSNKQDFKKLSKDYLSRQNLDKNIPDLHDKESKLNEFDNLEPWLVNEELKGTQFSFYLDEKKEKLLLIGKHTIQVWYNQGPSKDPEKRTLEFIYMPLFPLPVFSSPKIHEVKEWESNTIEVIGIEYCIGKFKLSFLTKDTKDSLQIKMEDEDDIINVAKYACYTLEYFSVYKNFKQTREKGQELKFNNIIKQTRKIILRFIRICPINWRLLDIRFGLMNVLIEAGDYELINDILSFGIPIHIPQYFPWSSEKNTICTALLDHTMLALLLEYYSNNAVDNIGWMRTVVDIIPELFKSSEEKIGNEKVEFYTFYAQKLFYKPCFCNKQLDLLSFKFLEVSPKSNDLLKVFIPITQLIPQDSELDICDIDYNKIVDIRMVPLTDFTTSKRISDIRERKPTNFLKLLISPSQYSSLKEEDYSPFIKLVKTGEREILYENPSMGAVINWMWHCSKFYWPRTLYIFVLYFLTYSIISWAYIAHIQITSVLHYLLIITTIILFYYLSFYQTVVVFKQLHHKRIQYLDRFNLVDLLSLIIPIFIVSYILIHYYTFDDKFKNAESSQVLTFIIFISIIVLWHKFILLLRIFEVVIGAGHALFILLGHPFYIGLNQSRTIYQLSNGSEVYTLTGDKPNNPFSSIIDAILAVYNWSSISLDTWNFWPLTIISVICSFIFVIILQNVIISFMSDAFSDAVKNSKRGVYRYQVDLIYEFALLEKSLEFNNLDFKFKDKIRVKYICFYDEPHITISWKKISDKMKSKSYPKIQSLNKSGFESWLDEECKFIWKKEIKDV